MGNEKVQISEFLVRLMVLGFLDSQYPTEVEYEKLEKVMEIVCSPRKLARILAYLTEKGFAEGYVGPKGSMYLVSGKGRINLTMLGKHP